LNHGTGTQNRRRTCLSSYVCTILLIKHNPHIYRPSAAVCLTRLAISPLSRTEKSKHWRRVLHDAIYRWLIYTLPIPTLAGLFPSTEDVYTAWVKKHKLPVVIEDLPDSEDAKLFWIGDKAAKKVVLYMHGGGFSLGMPDASCDFWWYIIKQVKMDTGVDIGIAILRYGTWFPSVKSISQPLMLNNLCTGLVPKQHFPTPLRQTIAGLSHLLAPSSGRSPGDIILSGDSAGGNMVLQLLLHTAKPMPSIPSQPSLAVPPSPLSNPEMEGKKLLGAYMMSPYLDLLARNPACKSYVTNYDSDITSQVKLEDFGQRVMAGIPTSDPEVAKLLPYIDSQLAPAGFYSDLPSTISSILISAGGGEALLDDIIQFGEILKSTTDGKAMETRVLVDDFGVHLDPMLDFFAGMPEDKLGSVTKDIVKWFGERVTA